MNHIKSKLKKLVVECIDEPWHLRKISNEIYDNTYNVIIKFAFYNKRFNTNEFIIQEIYCDKEMTLSLYIKYIGA